MLLQCREALPGAGQIGPGRPLPGVFVPKRNARPGTRRCSVQLDALRVAAPPRKSLERHGRTDFDQIAPDPTMPAPLSGGAQVCPAGFTGLWNALHGNRGSFTDCRTVIVLTTTGSQIAFSQTFSI